MWTPTAPDAGPVENYRSNIAQSLFYVDGKPFSLHNYPMYLAIYDGYYPRLLLKTGRQVAKSTTMASFMVAQSVGKPQFKSYYISPTAEQTRKFSHTRIAKLLAYSPDLRRYFVGPESIDSVLLRMLKNGSEMAFTYALDDADRGRGYTANLCCFDNNAEALTRTGWRQVKDLTYADEIADVNDDEVIEWQRPTALIHRVYHGNMVKFQHAGASLRVTGEHKMWVNYHIKPYKGYKTLDAYEFAEAATLARTKRMGFKMTNACRSTSYTPINKVLPGVAGYAVSTRSVLVPYSAFATLIGWFLAEGHLQWSCYKGQRRAASMVLTQNESQYSQEIESCLIACGFQFSKRSRINPKGGNRINSYTVASSQLGAYCVPLGKCRDKYIPEEFFEHTSLLEPLLRALYAGDASYHQGDTWDQGVLRTRSRQLADDVHRAWTLLGRAAVIHTRQMPPRPGATPEPLYEIQAYKNNYAVFWRSEFRTKNRVTEETVAGENVHCFTVPHHRPIIRGGFGQRPFITGQCFDEAQEMLFESVIPVIEECMSNQDEAYSIYCGTPKTMENTIEVLWDRSTQTEWCIPCSGCGRSTFIETTKSLGPGGPECLACRKLLNPRLGRWVDMKPNVGIKGFHISQPMMPSNVPASWNSSDEYYPTAVTRWERILYKMENWGEIKFLNECIGVSTSTGARLLTKEILESLCDESHEMTRLPLTNSKAGIRRTIAGIDWSGGGGEVKGMEGLLKSRTVLNIWGDTGDGRLKILHYKIFPNGHPTGWIDEIVDLCKNWGVELACGDAGEGALANAMLRDRLGAHRMVQVRYLNASKPIEWNPHTLAYHCDRTTLIDNYALFLTHKLAVFPKLSQAKPAIDDILNVYEETTMSGKKVWRHATTQPDDCLHAQIFGWLAWRILTQDLRFYV